MLARAAILEEEEKEEEEGTSKSSLEELGLWGERGRRRMAAKGTCTCDEMHASSSAPPLDG